MEHLRRQGDGVPQVLHQSLRAFCMRNEERRPLQKLLYRDGENLPPGSTETFMEGYFLCLSRRAICRTSGMQQDPRQCGKKYLWPRLPNMVRNYVRRCRECQRRKTPPTRLASFLQRIKPPREPPKQIGIDLLGPFRLSSTCNRWIIVATDYSTRYAETSYLTLPHRTATEVARFFAECILLRHGVLEVIITERGTAFTSRLMQDVMRLSHTLRRKTMAYHTGRNELTECLNTTIEDMLSMYVDV